MDISKRWFSLIGIALLCLGMIPSVTAQEVGLTFPEPTGSPVGYRLYAVTDEEREEIFTQDTEDVRAFPLAIYYPATPTADALPAPYATEAERAAYETALMIPPVVFDSIESHLFVDAPLIPQAGGYPVLLFSPGFGAAVRLYSALLAEVASQGFVVVVVDHPYSQAASVFPDETVITANAAGSNLETSAALDEVLTVWIEDMQYALDYVAELNANDPILAGAFDLARVGAFGHSFGGASAANLTLVDDRVLASINMDGTVFGNAAQGVTKPFMMMTAPPVQYSDADLATVGMTQAAYQAILTEFSDSVTGALVTSEAPYHLALTGALHSTFISDVVLLQALLPEAITPEMVGTIDGPRANDIIAAYTVAFFNTHLLNEPSPLLEGDSDDYPEVEFVME